MIYIILNIVGLLLDLCGFIGIYKTKIKPVKLTNPSRAFYKSKYFGHENNIKSVSEDILRQVNDTFKELNDEYSKEQKKTLPYFLLVIFGVGIQILSIIIYAVYYYK